MLLGDLFSRVGKSVDPEDVIGMFVVDTCRVSESGTCHL